MTAIENAIVRARRGIDWQYPCLIWVADYLLDATGVDYAIGWRRVGWDEPTAKRALVALSRGGRGISAVEKALDNMAEAQGWERAEENRQGAVMIGVFNELAADGVPAIFDGTDRWIAGHVGGGAVTSVGVFPDRAWEVLRA